VASPQVSESNRSSKVKTLFVSTFWY
jgi:hypothetical protein